MADPGYDVRALIAQLGTTVRGDSHQRSRCVSEAAGERVLLPAVRAAPGGMLILADGFSCRTQIQHETERQPLHLAQVLASALPRR